MVPASNKACCSVPVISALRQRQEDEKFKVIPQIVAASLGLIWDAGDLVSKKSIVVAFYLILVQEMA